MSASFAYFDHAATTPLDPEVREAMLPWLGGGRFGNPSSRHALGVRAAEALEEARGRVARALGARSAQVVFTSGGTEANALGVLGAARARRRPRGEPGERRARRVLVGATEHSCVRGAAALLEREGFELVRLALDEQGALDLDALAQALDERVALVALMRVQNEVGSVYPVREAARLVRARAPEAWLHVDAVQAFGKLPLNWLELECDSLALSAHKVHGPQGVGALVRREDGRLEPLWEGGGQEGGLRAGTENLAGAIGFGVAAELAARRQPAAHEHLTRLRARLLEVVATLEGVRVLEPGAPRQPLSPAIVALRLRQAPAELVLHHMEARGVLVGAGSACQSRKREPSPALAALGLASEVAKRVLRVSFSSSTSEDELERLLEALVAVVGELEPARKR